MQWTSSTDDDANIKRILVDIIFFFGLVMSVTQRHRIFNREII